MGALVGTVQGVVDLDTGEEFLADRSINHVARDGDDWWAVDDAGGLWRGEDRAAQADDAVFQCVLPVGHGVWLGADSARLYRYDEEGLAVDPGFSEAPGRESWHTPWGGPPDVRSMAFGPDGILYVNVHVGGILYYDDAGVTPTLDIHADVHQVVAHPSRPALVLAATAFGLAVSTNGHDYDFRTDGLAHEYCRAVAVRNGTVVVSAARGPSGGDAAIYRGEVDGGRLRRCEHGLPESFAGNLDTHCLMATGEGFIAVNDSSAWRSDDDGLTWQVVTADLPRVTCLAV